MSTERQRAANQQNAAKSTGPRTAEGKSASAQNARQHGFRAKHVTLETLEEISEYDDRVEELLAAAPPDPFIPELAQRIATQEILLHRIQRSLTAAYTELNNQTIDNTWGKTEPFPDDAQAIDEIGTAVLGKTALADAAGPNTFGTITRYYAEHERIWNRAVKHYNQIRESAAKPAERSPVSNDRVSETPHEAANPPAGPSPIAAKPDFTQSNPIPPDAQTSAADPCGHRAPARCLSNPSAPTHRFTGVSAPPTRTPSEESAQSNPIQEPVQ